MKKLALTLVFLLLTTSVFAQFSDTSEHWGAEAIEWTVNREIMNGYPDGTFRPDGLITRAEALKTITVLYGIKSDPTTFSDVSKDKWYYEYIIDGYSAMPDITDGQFRPDDKITRQDAIYAIIKAKFGDVKPKNPDFLSFYADSYLIADYARDAFAFAKESGIIQGYENNTLNPKFTITRAEFATVLKNADNTIDVTDEPTPQPESEKTEETQTIVSNFIPIVSVGSAENENGVTVSKITGLKLGKEVSFLSTESYENNVKAGDIIVPVLNHKGLVKSCNVLSTVENNKVVFGKEYMNNTNKKTKKTRYYFGEIENIIKGKYVTLKNNSYSSQSFDLEFSVDNAAEIYFYNTMFKNKSRLYEESLDILYFEDGKAYVNNTQASAAYIVARETDGEVTEVGVYIIK